MLTVRAHACIYNCVAFAQANKIVVWSVVTISVVLGNHLGCHSYMARADDLSKI